MSAKPQSPVKFVYFVGYGRSGHSLVGALLDAHPECCISHELDAFGRIRDGADRETLFAEIKANSARHAREGRTWHRNGQTQYHYAVEGQYQGRTLEPLVLGDKKGGRTTRHLATDPDLVDKARTVLGIDLCPVLVLRHPLDNVASMVVEGGDLEAAIEDYSVLTRQLAKVLETVLPLVLTHESFVRKTREELYALAEHLGLQRRPAWARSCAAIVSKEPSLSRLRYEWSEENLRSVRQIVDAAPFLHRYTGDRVPYL